MGLEDALRHVREFHLRIGAPISVTPRLLPCHQESACEWATRFAELSREAWQQSAATDDLLLQRLAMSLEEISEWLAAHAHRDLVEAADAWADRAYLLIGDAVAAGLPVEDLFFEIHRSNMTKAPADLEGKGTKSHEYQPTEIEAMLTKVQNRATRK